MYCVNHPGENASGACVGCGKFFCATCLNEIKGKYYCKNCIGELFDNQAKKIEHLENKQPPMVFMNAGGGAASSSSSATGGFNKRYNRSKGIAALLAFLLGGLGVHKFYLGKTGQGVLYILFCWTFIPSIIAFFECIFYLLMSENNFDRKYNY